MSRCPIAFLLVCLSASVLTAAERAEWPQWRGPNRDARIEAATWPERLEGEHLEQVWRVELGPSYSGPIVSTDHVFVTETVDKENEVVRALERDTGKEVWKQSWAGAMSVPFFARANGDWIRSTPAYDGERLYVAGMKDVLVCLDAATGKVVWRKDFVADLKTKVPAFGFVCSPLVHGDHVYVQAGEAFTKLEKKTGKIVWQKLKDGGGMFGSAFSSPVIEKLAGREQLLVQTRTTLAGVDPADGKALWTQKIPAFRGMNILTPTVHDGSVFTSSYGGGAFLFDVAKDENAGTLEATETWKQKTEGYMSSPVVIGNHAYLHLRNERFTCIDLATGQSTWTTGPMGKYWSMVANGNRILALTNDGELVLIEANPDEYEEIDRRKVSEESTWAHLAVCDDHVFVRELKAMAVYRWK